MKSFSARQLVFVLMLLTVAVCGFTYAGSSAPWAGASLAQLPTASTPAPPFVTKGTVTPTSVIFTWEPDLSIPGVAVPDVYYVVSDGEIGPITPAEPWYSRERIINSLLPGSSHTYLVYAGRTGSYGTRMWSDPTTLLVTLPNLYNITPVAGTGGSILPATVQGVTQGTNSPYFYVTPDPGYRVNEIKDGTTVLTGRLKLDGSVEYRFLDVQAAHEIAATFVKTWNVSAVTPENGSITPVGTAVVDDGGTVSYAVTPNAGYRVASVTDNGNPVSLTGGAYVLKNVTEDHWIAATFEVNPIVSVSAVALGKPSVPKSGKTKKAIKVSGAISSAISVSTAMPVNLKFYRLQKRGRKSVWVLRKTIPASRPSTTSYAGSLKLKPTGTWSVIAQTSGDSQHARAVSARSRSFKIK